MEDNAGERAMHDASGGWTSSWGHVPQHLGCISVPQKVARIRKKRRKKGSTGRTCAACVCYIPRKWGPLEPPHLPVGGVPSRIFQRSSTREIM